MRIIFSRLGLIAIFSFLLTGCTIPFLGGNKQAALQVSSTPKATVFLDGEHVGATPYFDEKLKPGEHTLKLVPEDSQSISWETKIKLTSGILTVVSREMAATLDESSGYVLTLDPAVDKKNVGLAVVTVPDGAVVSLDSEPKGFSPLSLDGLAEGDHLLAISSPGYVEKSLKAKLVAGHKLTANVQLAKLPEEASKAPTPEATQSAEVTESSPKPSPTPKATPSAKTATSSATATASVIAGATDPQTLTKPYVKILEAAAGVNWLRVHSEAVSGSGNEVAKVKVGTYFEVTDEKTGWYQIDYGTGEGWIASQYGELVK
ncbi:hypothetical protein A2160_03795 [Candidatus Beckwithbacteria bacterium RBG_13_42_9]|uniref:SH3b domain-containing protein n=1 Tax=Candidatus Beckwithbacteria bacterium RBG_13_42_9 TaxID=1797457 RepID=A0A1F5E4P9_9BACT|nr:MAG: hypothetical protein A2160_03795 [Candidatus Beckwithbacteria bacterium RBG_13_42_9]